MSVSINISASVTGDTGSKSWTGGGFTIPEPSLISVTLTIADGGRGTLTLARSDGDRITVVPENNQQPGPISLARTLPAGSYMFIVERAGSQQPASWDASDKPFTIVGSATPNPLPQSSATEVQHPTVATSKALYASPHGLVGLQWGGKQYFGFYFDAMSLNEGEKIARLTSLKVNGTERFPYWSTGRSWNAGAKTVTYSLPSDGTLVTMQYRDFADTGSPDTFEAIVTVTNTSVSSTIDDITVAPFPVDRIALEQPEQFVGSADARFAPPFVVVTHNDDKSLICSCSPAGPTTPVRVGFTVVQNGAPRAPKISFLTLRWGAPISGVNAPTFALGPGESVSATVRIIFATAAPVADASQVSGLPQLISTWRDAFAARYPVNYARTKNSDRRPYLLVRNIVDGNPGGDNGPQNPTKWNWLPLSIDTRDTSNVTMMREFRNWLFGVFDTVCDEAVSGGAQGIIFWNFAGRYLNPGKQTPGNNIYTPGLFHGYVFAPETRWVDPADPQAGTTYQALLNRIRSRGLRVGGLMQGRYTGVVEAWTYEVLVSVNGGTPIQPYDVPINTPPSQCELVNRLYTDSQDMIDSTFDFLATHETEFGVTDWYWDVSPEFRFWPITPGGPGLLGGEVYVLRQLLEASPNASLRNVRWVTEYGDAGTSIAGSMRYFENPPFRPLSVRAGLPLYEPELSAVIGDAVGRAQEGWQRLSDATWEARVRAGDVPMSGATPGMLRAFAAAYGPASVVTDESSATVHLTLCDGMDRAWCIGLPGARHTIDWGDGTVNEIDGPALSASHTYATAGDWNITVETDVFPLASSADTTRTVTLGISLPDLSVSVLVAYREGDAASLAAAQAYRDARGLANGNLIPLACPATAVLPDKAAWDAAIGNRIADAVVGRSCRYVVLCPGVPLGYVASDGRVVSTTSAVSGIRLAGTAASANPNFDRRDTPVPTGGMLDLTPVCSMLVGDAATIETTLRSSERVARVGTVAGRFLYARRPATGDPGYEADEASLRSDVLPQTGLWYSVFDAVVPRAVGDSFVWSATPGQCGASFFSPASAPRVFLYNGQSPASTVSPAASGEWGPRAIAAGYPAVASHLDTVTAAELPRPAAFLRTLLAGGNVGEAMLAASPKLRTPVALFGDPFVIPRFPSGTRDHTALTPDSASAAVINRLGQAVACLARRTALLDGVAAAIHAGQDVSSMVEVLPTAAQYADALRGSHETELRDCVAVGLTLAAADRDPTGEEIAAAAERVGTLVPRLLGGALAARGVAVPEASLSPEGEWAVYIPVAAMPAGGPYHFLVQVRLASDGLVAFVADSSASQSAWTYMSSPGVFSAVPASGVPSSHAGVPVRFTVPLIGRQETAARLFLTVTQTNAAAQTAVTQRQLVVPS